MQLNFLGVNNVLKVICYYLLVSSSLEFYAPAASFNPLVGLNFFLL